MRVDPIVRILMSSCFIFALSHTAWAAPDLDQLKGLMGGGSSAPSMDSLASSNFGNMAGVLQYCATNNYLDAGSTGGVKDKMLAKLRTENTSKSAQPVNQSPEYLNGAKGMLSSSDGRQVDLGKPGIKETVTKKVCDTVLGQAKSFL
jgi:hypothetical protein